jgi:hypothetical protein
MAIVIRSDFPEIIGLPVDVALDSRVIDGRFCWRAQASKKLVCENYATGLPMTSDWFYAPDSDLRPITGLPVDEGIHDEVVA